MIWKPILRNKRNVPLKYYVEYILQWLSRCSNVGEYKNLSTTVEELYKLPRVLMASSKIFLGFTPLYLQKQIQAKTAIFKPPIIDLAEYLCMHIGRNQEKIFRRAYWVEKLPKSPKDSQTFPCSRRTSIAEKWHVKTPAFVTSTRQKEQNINLRNSLLSELVRNWAVSDEPPMSHYRIIRPNIKANNLAHLQLSWKQWWMILPEPLLTHMRQLPG